MAETLVLPGNLRASIFEEARAALPRECCGLIEGVRENETIRAIAVHPARNLAEESDRFEIDPAEQFQLLHSLRGTGREIVGCYHSHPNGVAAPSALDLARAEDDGFVWLVAASSHEKACLGAYIFRAGRFHPLTLT
jgi:proteasome lid subunit RPN8/RPN11